MPKTREREYDPDEFLNRIPCKTNVDEILTDAEVEFHRGDPPRVGQKFYDAREKVAQEVKKLVSTNRFEEARGLINEYEELYSAD